MSWWRPRRWRARALLALATVGALGAGTAAFATHVDNMFKTANYNPDCRDGSLGDPFCQTDNATLTVFRQSSLSSTGRSNIAAALNNEYAPTDLSVSFPSTPSYSGSAETDIIYQQGTVSGTADGIAWCNDAVSSTKCDQHYNRFDSTSPSRALACHETGHAVGLTHGQQASPQLSNGDNSLGCMTTPVETSDLGSHNTNMINATYPN
jgi:hypothetical protein